MIPPTKIFFVINPASGKNSRKPDETEILEFFRNTPFEIKTALTGSNGHASDLTKNALGENFDVVVAVGGDGTVNEIAKVLNGTGKYLGIIPCGSGNGLARHHKIPFKISEALAVIAKNNVVNHDSVKINDHYSFNVSGIGFDAHVAHLFGKDGNRGFLNYVKLVVKEFSDYHEFSYSIDCTEKKESGKAMLIAIANASQFGNNARIAPSADTNDGKADITVVRKMNFLQLPYFAYKVFKGEVHHSQFTSVMDTEKIIITCNTEVPLHVDGEPAGFSKRFEISSLKSSLRLIVP